MSKEFDRAIKECERWFHVGEFPHFFEKRMIREGPRTYWEPTERALEAKRAFAKKYPREKL